MDDLNKLWEVYSQNKSKEIKDKLIIEYSQLVKVVAGRLNMYLGNNVEYEDLLGYGVFGLIDAIDKFDYKKGVKFETYASLRIRGAILDQIRKMDWIPRSLRQKQKKIETIKNELENKLGRQARDEEIAKGLGISKEQYLNWLSQLSMLNLISLDDFVEQGYENKIQPLQQQKFEQPEKVIEKKELKKILKTTLDELTENESKVIILYYYEELTLKEISYILGVSESRISQLHTKSLQKLKQKLGKYVDLLLL
ncbi:MAG: FliA/WhiG family RNA polymerase sigma factor [Eubacteriales bacterium]